MKECCDFCCLAGAESVYATGNDALKAFPVHTAILRMCRSKEGLPDTDAALFPLQEKTLSMWRELYNKRMSGIPNASYMTISDSQTLLCEGNGYFVHRGNTLLGIGISSSDTISCVISAVHGAGRDVLCALSRALLSDTVVIEVASVNTAAIRLYERLGFIQTDEVSVWYKIK
ncbi:MAG: hypothetical protein IKC95_01930 [Oscillospiraceae bacterium]|nr:hypothetical protein [Oscillospiraceae bacterium]